MTGTPRSGLRALQAVLRGLGIAAPEPDPALEGLYRAWVFPHGDADAIRHHRPRAATPEPDAEDRLRRLLAKRCQAHAAWASVSAYLAGLPRLADYLPAGARAVWIEVTRPEAAVRDSLMAAWGFRADAALDLIAHYQRLTADLDAAVWNYSEALRYPVRAARQLADYLGVPPTSQAVDALDPLRCRHLIHGAAIGAGLDPGRRDLTAAGPPVDLVAIAADLVGPDVDA